MNVVNTELMGQVRDIIVLHPERHNQATWVRPVTSCYEGTITVSRMREQCGSTACVAGWATLLSAPDETPLTYDGHLILLVLPDGRWQAIAEYAEKKLGLTEDQGGWLFDACLSRSAVLKALDYLPDHPDATGEELSKFCGE